MAQKAEYRVLMGNASKIQTELGSLAQDNWKPILMSTVPPAPQGQIQIIVIVERPLGG